MILMAAPAANAGGLVHKMSSSVQLTVDSARTTATRLGSQYSVSGSNVNTTDGTTAGTISAGTISSGIYDPGTISATQATAGEAFSFSSSFLQGDAVPTSAPTVGAVGNFPLTLLELLVIWQVLSQLTVVSQSQLAELVALLLANLSQRLR
jgi:hypothetical protein